MNIEYLPFFEDEFLLRATDPLRWDTLMNALQDIRVPDDEEANIRGIAALLSLVSLHSGEKDDIIPIIARRFVNDLERMQSPQARSALQTLEGAVQRYEFKEDCPSLGACAQKDQLRRDFIEAGKWTDTNVAYEHILQKHEEIEQAKVRETQKKAKRFLLAENLISIPIMVFLPLGLFLALISSFIVEYEFSRSFMLTALILFSIEALTIYLSFPLAVFQKISGPVSSTRILAAILILVLCVVSLVITYIRSSQRDTFVSVNMCGPLALAQLLVWLIGISLLLDYRAVRRIRAAEAALTTSPEDLDNLDN